MKKIPEGKDILNHEGFFLFKKPQKESESSIMNNRRYALYGNESEYDDDEEICEDKYSKTLANMRSDSGSKTKKSNRLPSYTPTSISTSAHKSRKDKASTPNGAKTQQDFAMAPESLDTIQTIKKQMEDILKFNKHDRIAQETLNIMLNKEKEYKEREEKKLRTQKRSHLKSFKK